MSHTCSPSRPTGLSRTLTLNPATVPTLTPGCVGHIDQAWARTLSELWPTRRVFFSTPSECGPHVLRCSPHLLHIGHTCLGADESCVASLEVFDDSTGGAAHTSVVSATHLEVEGIVGHIPARLANASTSIGRTLIYADEASEDIAHTFTSAGNFVKGNQRRLAPRPLLSEQRHRRSFSMGKSIALSLMMRRSWSVDFP